jgi:hypothetical protein
MSFAVISSGLLPHGIEQAVRAQSVTAASQSYGLVALALLIVLLFEWEALRLVAPETGRRAVIVAISAPLLVVFALTIAARLALLIH